MASKFTVNHGLAIFCMVAASLSHAELRDPTKPATFVYTESEAQPGKLTLSATWISKLSKRATINGITAKQGQTILNDVKIIQVQPQFVIILQNGRNKKLRLLQHTVKKP